MTRQIICPRCRATNVGKQTHCLLCWAELPAVGSAKGAAPVDWGAQPPQPNLSSAGGPTPGPYQVGPTAAPPPARLTLVSGSGPAYVDLAPGGLTIGRATTNGLWLGNDSNVSRQHARLDYAGGQWVLTDLNSSNGTYLNSARVMRQALRPGDRIQIGQAVWVFEA